MSPPVLSVLRVPLNYAMDHAAEDTTETMLTLDGRGSAMSSWSSTSSRPRFALGGELDVTTGNRRMSYSAIRSSGVPPFRGSVLPRNYNERVRSVASGVEHTRYTKGSHM